MAWDTRGGIPAAAGLQDRIAFVRQVYLWLVGGFAVAGLGALSGPFVAAWLLPLTGRFFVWVLFGAQFGTLLWASAVSRRKPMNRLAFGVFTFVSGVIAGILSLVVARQAGLGTVLAAFGMTAADFLVLTAVAMVSRRDFSFLRSFVIVGISIMFFGGLIAAIFNLSTLSLLVSAVAVIACSAKLLWDTSAMLRTGDLEDPAGFALSLFVSLYNIFISLLNLLGNRRS
ncbi:MAG: Bax inhibitor-1/YccA family protein [Acidobacteria bacterium]|nr:Bax inhibitor-1/YccA family protein [Acidobacteriota bacterium]